MQKTFIVILIFVLIIVLFALQNVQVVYVDFWFAGLNTNLSTVIFLSFTFGALLSFLFSLPYRSQKNKTVKAQNDKINSLEQEIVQLKTTTHMVEKNEMDDLESN